MRVFISYSNRDKEVVRRMADDLRRHGVTVWMDEDIVSPGDPWAEKLSHAVSESDAVIIVMSLQTAASQWQTSEIAFAIAAQKRDATKRVIPVLVEKGAELPFFLKSLVYCDLSDDAAYQRNFPQLVQALERPRAAMVDVPDADRVRIESLKAERMLLTQEKEAQARKKAMWTISILGALASVIAASVTMFAGVLANTHWGQRTFNFVIGAAAGVLATLVAFAASRILHGRHHRMEGKDANQ